MNIEKILLARNELENKVNDLRDMLQLSEADMLVACEMVLSTARHQALVRDIYNRTKVVNKESEDGNSNETRQ